MLPEASRCFVHGGCVIPRRQPAPRPHCVRFRSVRAARVCYQDRIRPGQRDESIALGFGDRGQAHYRFIPEREPFACRGFQGVQDDCVQGTHGGSGEIGGPFFGVSIGQAQRDEAQRERGGPTTGITPRRQGGGPCLEERTPPVLPVLGQGELEPLPATLPIERAEQARVFEVHGKTIHRAATRLGDRTQVAHGSAAHGIHERPAAVSQRVDGGGDLIEAVHARRGRGWASGRGHQAAGEDENADGADRAEGDVQGGAPFGNAESFHRSTTMRWPLETPSGRRASRK